MENKLGLDNLLDLSIVGVVDSEVIKDDSFDSVNNLREKILTDIEKLIDELGKIIINEMLSKDSYNRLIEECTDKLGRLHASIYNVNVQQYFNFVSKHDNFNPFLVIDDFKYKEIADMLSYIYRRYNMSGIGKDKMVLFNVYNLFKKLAYDIGIRSYDASILSSIINRENENLLDLDGSEFDESVYSDKDFNESFSNDTGIQIKSIPYYVSAIVFYPNGTHETIIKTISKGRLIYSQSKYDELFPNYSNSLKKTI